MNLACMHARLIAAIVLPLSLIAFASAAAPSPQKWKPVAPVDWSKIKLTDFSDDELDLPFFLHHFHTVADAVEENGATRGFMTKPVWRGRDKNQQGPWNARVMESHLTLAFFYCSDRPWNSYFGDWNVRDRLEAMLTFWCDMQNADGRFSEYGPKQWNLPATAFATKFMGQTLTLLKRSGQRAAIDPALHQRIVEVDRKAILATLTRDDLYTHGKRFTNQYTNVFAGTAAFLDLFPDDPSAGEIRALLQKKFVDADKDFRSPCGYFYEADGPDFGYTLHTHHSNAQMAYHYFGHGTPIGDALEKQDAAWNEWLGYNLLREPDGSTFVFNRGVQTRQNQPDWPRHDGPFAERVEAARAFATSREERAAAAKTKRDELAKSWGTFPGLVFTGEPARGSPVSPYNFLHRDHKVYPPTDAERAAAIAKLPYLASDRFIKQFKDTRKNAVFTYIRRPTYYAAFNSGEQITAQQRLGLGVLWNPNTGTLVQSQTGSDDHAWGTRAAGAAQAYEAGKVDAEFQDEMKRIVYSLGTAGRKTITFSNLGIEVNIEHAGDFAEQIPLLTSPAAPLIVLAGAAAVPHPGYTLEVSFPRDLKLRRMDGRTLFGSTKVTTLALSSTDTLTYRLTIKAATK